MRRDQEHLSFQVTRFKTYTLIMFMMIMLVILFMMIMLVIMM
jgi:hypothetical protein